MDWLNLTETQRSRLRTWVIDQCRDRLGNITPEPTPAPESEDPEAPVTL